MRVLGGSLKGQKIDGIFDKIRPTTNKVKEALFSMIDVDSKEVLDLYSGSGALSFESISRGASRVTMVDIDPKTVKTLKRNADRLGISDRCYIMRKKADRAITYLSSSQSFDIIILDPPYFSSEYDSLLNLIFHSNILSKDAIVIVEHSKRTTFNTLLTSFKEKRYGDTKITFFRKECVNEE